MNTGTKQATVAYKVSSNGQPVDINGQLTSVSGKKQAIALLAGRPNPNPALYEVEYYFSAGGFVAGQPTTEIDLQYCPVHYISVSTNRIVLDPDNPTMGVIVMSSYSWHISETSIVADVAPISGSKGKSYITFTKNSNVGNGYFTFMNDLTGQLARIRVFNVNSKPWILETGFWNDLGFWYNESIWKF